MKKIIDRYFTDNYKSLYDLAQARILTYNREFDPSYLVGNAYEYCLKHEESLKCDTIVQVYAFRFITMQCYWSRSESNIEFQRIGESRIIQSEEVDDIDEKVIVEEYINTRSAVLEMFKCYLKEKDIVKYRTLELMLRGYNSSGLLAEHLGISRTAAWNFLRNVRYELNKYKKRYNL